MPTYSFPIQSDTGAVVDDTEPIELPDDTAARNYGQRMFSFGSERRITCVPAMNGLHSVTFRCNRCGTETTRDFKADESHPALRNVE